MPKVLKPKPKPKVRIRSLEARPRDELKVFNLRVYDPSTGSQIDKKYRSMPKLEQWREYYKRKGNKTRRI